MWGKTLGEWTFLIPTHHLISFWLGRISMTGCRNRTGWRILELSLRSRRKKNHHVSSAYSCTSSHLVKSSGGLCVSVSSCLTDPHLHNNFIMTTETVNIMQEGSKTVIISQLITHVDPITSLLKQQTHKTQLSPSCDIMFIKIINNNVIRLTCY